MARSVKTDNSFLIDKVKMRSNHLPELEEIRVLDAYSSHGLIWNLVKELNPNTSFNITRLDREVGKKGFYIRTDNVRFLASSDLNEYDVIDLDAYGVPFNQMEYLFKKREEFDHVVGVFVTLNTIGMGKMPLELLKVVGITSKMYKKSPILCSKHPRDKIFGYLAERGVREVYVREQTNAAGMHLYLYFTLGEKT